MSNIPKGYIKKKSVTIPFGYKLSSIEGYLEPIKSELKILNKYVQSVLNQEYSLRKAAELITEETGRKISHVGLSQIIQKTPQPKVKYKYSPEQKRKQKLARDKKEIDKAKKKIAYKESKLKKEQEVIKKATEKTTSKIVSDKDLEQVAPSVQEIIKESNVIFHPNEGPQTEFLSSNEREVLYGGSAGGGKSYAMLADPVRY